MECFVVVMCKKTNRYLVYLVTTVALLTAGCSLISDKNTFDYEKETDSNTLERIAWWGFEIPTNASVVYKKYSKNPGWDGGNDNAYIILESEKPFKTTEGLLFEEKSFFKEKWEELNASESSEEPNFENELECYILTKWVLEEEQKAFLTKALSSDTYYSRTDYVDNYRFIGKGYFICQTVSSNRSLLFASLSYDGAYRELINNTFSCLSDLS